MESQPQDQPVAPPKSEDAPQQNPAERRINQLFARAKTAEERVQALEAQQQELQTRFLEIQQENTVLKGTQSGPSSADRLYAGTDLAGTKTVPNSGGDLIETFRNELKNAMTGMREEFRLERATAQLRENYG